MLGIRLVAGEGRQATVDVEVAVPITIGPGECPAVEWGGS